ncbi:MAG: MarR family transcriptional regulator [Clostridia bacterium]|nr:MarR family transcriptional regulator [Clostridia bacterium]
MTASAYGASIWRFSRILNDCLSKTLRPIARRYGITQAQAQLIFSVHYDKEATVGTIAQRLGLARTNASAMCKKLAGMGFLRRKRREDDERIVSLTLTENGRSAARAIERRIEKIYRKKFVDMQKIEKLTLTFEEISNLLKEENE